MLGTMRGIMIRVQVYKATELDEYPAHTDYRGQIEIQSVDVARDGEAEWRAQDVRLAAVSKAIVTLLLPPHITECRTVAR